MTYFVMLAVKLDTIIHPDADQGKPILLYSSELIPNDSSIVYRYTIRTNDAMASACEDQSFSALHAALSRRVSGVTSPPLLCRILQKPLVYTKRERWDGSRFHLEDEVGCFRRFRARAAFALFSPEPPLALSMTDLYSLDVQTGHIHNFAQSLNAEGVNLNLMRDGTLQIRGQLDKSAPAFCNLPSAEFAFSGVAGAAPVNADMVFFTQAVPGGRRFTLTPLSATVGTANVGPPTRTYSLVRRVPQIPFSITINALGREIKIQPIKNTAESDFAAWIVVPGHANDADDYGEFVGVAIARLLSIGHRARTPVVAHRRVWDGLGEQISLFSNTWSDIATPLIPREEIKNFLEQSLDIYISRVESHRLFALAEYYVRSFIEDTAEHKFTFASIFMEAFKFSWASNDQTGDIIRDTKQNGMIRGFRKQPNAGQIAAAQQNGGAPKTSEWQFEELLNRYASTFCGPNGFSFIENRNALFHTGLSASVQINGTSSGSYQYLKPQLESLQTQMEDILLGIVLGYSGKIHEYRKPDDVATFPGRAPVLQSPPSTASIVIQSLDNN